MSSLCFLGLRNFIGKLENLADTNKTKHGSESSEDASDSHRESSASSSRLSFDISSDEAKAKECYSPVQLVESIGKGKLPKCTLFDAFANENKTHLKDRNVGSEVSEMENMKKKFAKLLLGEDMSGGGKGVCSALAISNAITNLSATAFGQLWRLEPLPSEKKSMWQREMECLLRVCDHIVELVPSWQTSSDGNMIEVMTSRQRADLYMDLPALRKLDNMLLEILDSFKNTEFWYIDQGITKFTASDANLSASFSKITQRQYENWWLPVPRVPSGGLPENTRKKLNHKRDCANQILKAAMAINSITLAEMEIPESYFETLPKNGRACLGNVIYHYITSEQFSSDCLLDCLDLSSERSALEIANRVETSIHLWCSKPHSSPITNPSHSTPKSSWEAVRDLMTDGDKKEILAERAESLLLSLKQRFPCLNQTTLDTIKIQHNKDIGKSILESYSRVLENLAFSIVARIDDLLYVDNITRHSDKLSSVPTVGVISRKRVTTPYPVSASGTPYKSAFSTPKFSPAHVVSSPAKPERSPYNDANYSRLPHRGFGVKRVLNNYLGGDVKVKNCDNQLEGAGTVVPASGTQKEEP